MEAVHLFEDSTPRPLPELIRGIIRFSAPAMISGNLAVHRVQGDQHAVSHVPTGYRIVLCENYDAAHRCLSELARFSWGQITPGEGKPSGFSDDDLEKIKVIRDAFMVEENY